VSHARPPVVSQRAIGIEAHRPTVYDPLPVSEEPPSSATGEDSAPGSAAGDSIAVSVLGPVALGHGPLRQAVAAPRARALLALLAARVGQVVPADRLIDDLWANDPPASARNALRVHLSKLRAMLGSAGGGVTVEHRPPGYVLGGQGWAVDAIVAEQALRRVARSTLTETVSVCDESLALWYGEPYEDVELTAIDAERHRLAQLHLDLLEARADAMVALRPPDGGLVAELEMLVAAAPLREHSTELLMLALYRRGREAEALAVYTRLRHRLSEDLGLLPSRALQDLEAAVLRQDPLLDWRPPAGTAPPAMVVHHPEPPRPAWSAPAANAGAFIGRSPETDHVLAHRLAEPSTGITLVLGEPGIGKSRLLDELTRRWRDSDVTVLVGACDPHRTVPYHPFVVILHHLRQTRLVDTEMLTSLPYGPLSRPGGDGRLQLFAAVVEVIEQIVAASPGGFVLAVDDLQWIDDASAALLRHLVDLRPPMPVFLLLTARPDDPDESPAWRALLRTIAGRADTVELTGLAPDDLVHLLHGVEIDPGAVEAVTRRLHQRTDGNPLLATELIAEVHRRLTAGDTLTAALDALPTGVAAAVRARLKGLTPATRRLVELAALAGRRPSTEILAAALGESRELVFALRAVAVEVGLLVDDGGDPDLARFRHDLVRDAVVAAMTDSARRHGHAALARATAAVAVPDDDSVLLSAHHHLEAGPACDPTETVEAANRAAEIALRLYAFADAAGYAQRALALTGQSPPDPQRLFDLLVTAGEAQAHLGDAAAVRDLVDRAAVVARRLDDPHRLAVAALAGGLPDRPIGGVARPEALLWEALDGLEGHRCVTRVRVLSALARDGAMPGRFTDRRRLADEAVMLARAAGDTRELFDALDAWMLQHLGVPGSRRLDAASELVRLAAAVGDPVLATRAHISRLSELLCLGDVSGAEADLADVRSLVARTHRPRDQWQLAVTEAALRRLRGDLDGAAGEARAALDIAQRGGVADGVLSFAVHTFFDAFHRGTLGSLPTETRAVAEHFPTIGSLRLAAELVAGHARGRPDPVIAEAVLGDVVSRPADDWLWSTALAIGVLLAGEAGVTAHDDVLGARLEPFAGTMIIAGAVTATVGPADLYLAKLARADGRTDEALSRIDRALALTQGMGATVWSMWCRAEQAAALAPVDPGAARRLARDTAAGARLLGLDGPALAAEAAPGTQPLRAV
jgi:DNA-binding SARP family transcriptional activator